MAPKQLTASPKKRQSSLMQGTISFKTTKRGAAASTKAKAKTKAKIKTKTISRVKSETESECENANEKIIAEDLASEDEGSSSSAKIPLDMDDKSGKYIKYFREVKEMMGGMKPLHADGETKVHQMLRVFDNTYDYGPCVGLTRLERWERAEALGLNPPIEVRDILLTEQGSTNEDLVHPVFYGQVL